jgi:hypothetical protein
MEHAQKVRHLEEARKLRRLGDPVIYPAANAQGCAMAHFAFTPPAAKPLSQMNTAEPMPKPVAPHLLKRTA